MATYILANRGKKPYVPDYAYVDQYFPHYGADTGFGSQTNSGWTNSTGFGARTTQGLRQNTQDNAYTYRATRLAQDMERVKAAAKQMETLGIDPTQYVGSEIKKIYNQPEQGFAFAPKGKSSFGSSDVGYGQTASERTQNRITAGNKKVAAAQKILDQATPGMPLTSAQRTAFEIVRREQGDMAADIQAQSMIAKLEAQWQKRINAERDQNRRDKMVEQRDAAIQLARDNYGLRKGVVEQKASDAQTLQANVDRFNADFSQLPPEVQAEGAGLLTQVRNGMSVDMAISAAQAKAAAKANAIEWQQVEKPALDAQIRSANTVSQRAERVNGAIAKAQNKLGMIDSILVELEKPEVAALSAERIAELKLAKVGVEASINNWNAYLQRNNVQPSATRSFSSIDEAAAANLPVGTEILINGRRAIVE